MIGVPAGSASAAGETRSLKLYFVHTGERAQITFKRNGRYDQKGLQEINRFLRDWRRNEPTRMDPRLFDLVWEVYRRVGASDYIHVVSAYRSPTTNGALRSRTKGVAKNSQHMLGKAMDFFIPGVKLATLRETAMRLQVGGVGFYPTSGSPFVHLDVGSVRAWPRMSRQELVRIFPNGNTMHLPADGKPLPGYEQAVADYKRRVGADSIQIASTAGGAPSSSSQKKPSNLFAMLFGNNGDEDEDADAIAAPSNVPQRPATRAPVAEDSEEAAAPVMVAAAAPPRAELTAAPEIAAPVPQTRPAFRDDAATGGLANALYSPQRNAAQEAMQAVMPTTPVTPLARPVPEGESFVDLASMKIPVPTLLGPRGLKGDAEPSSAMIASLGTETTGEVLLASVPVPAQRPQAALAAPVQVAAAAPLAERPAVAPHVAVATATPAPVTAQQDLTPELIAELARSAEPQTATAYAATPIARPQQVALASPATVDNNARVFNDGFDMPKRTAPASQPTKVVKGGAVSKLGGRPANPDTKVLTGDVLSQWAVATNRTDTAASMKAPRLVARAFNSEVTTGYGGGFKPVSAAVAIDPNRFSGANQVKP
ncbi:DUF882 domain-containing protein [Rhizobium sp. 0TCS1.26]|uniref:DUF882 domain-containing protein n=1 Tax=Rhizobium sp. 0TCS1.26 TaxID=3142623 RepID=UPI003D2D055B